MTRLARAVSVAVLVAMLCASESPPPGAVAQEQQPPRPNVILIVTDDQREGLEVMPAVSRLFVEQGRSFPNAYTTTPQCCPARASILTGRYVHNHAAKNNATGRDIDPQTTLSYFLTAAGYRTGLFGKFVNRWGGRPPPYFHNWVTLKSGRDRYRNATYNVHGDYRDIPGYSTTVLGERARRFLHVADSKDDAQPWMLVFTPPAAHAPYRPEPKYRRVEVGQWRGNPAVYEYRTTQGKADKPGFLQGAARGAAKHVRAGQMRTLMSVDDAVARLFDTMNRLDEENTIAIFLSDNGLMWGEHGWVDKSVPHTYSVRVPFLMRWPGHVAGASTDDRLVANIDVTPTVLAAAGVAPDGATLDGRSLLDDTWTRSSILLEFFGPDGDNAVPPWASLRAPGYQYVEYYGPDGAVAFKEYYDLGADPWQLHNLYGDDDPANDPPEGPDLHEELAEARTCVGSSCP
jgi:arylsulfatase A-like enzyme